MLYFFMYCVAATVSAIFLHRLIELLSTQVQNRRYARRDRCRSPAYFPEPFPYTGQAFLKEYNSAWIQGDRGLWMRTLLANPGLTTAATVWGVKWIVTAHPENMRQILARSADCVAVEPSRKPRTKGWIGDGIFVSDGDRWRTSRALFKPMFGRLPISDLNRFDVHARRFLHSLPNDGATVDLQPMLKRLYLDVSTELLFGQSADSQLGERGAKLDIERFERSWEAAMFGMMRKIAQSRLMKLTEDDSEWKKSCAFVHGVFDGHIARVLARREKRALAEGAETKGGVEMEGDSMLERLSNRSTDKEFLRNQLLNVFVGARDTAGIGISDLFFHLARHPDVYAKLRDEVFSIGEQPVTFELLKSMKYLQAVLAESLRLLSPVSTAIRHATAPFTLPRGGGPTGESPVFVPAGSRLEINISALHQNGKYWGDDADDFLPDRWLPNRDQQSKGEHALRQEGQPSLLENASLETGDEPSGVGKPWQYVPFLGGARICPAQQMMLTQYAFLLVRFCQSVKRLENRDAEEKFVGQIVFSLQSKNGVQVAVYR